MRWRISEEDFAALNADRQADYEREDDGGYVTVVIEPDGSRAIAPESTAGLLSAFEKGKAEVARLKQSRDAVRSDSTNSETRTQLELLQARYDEIEAGEEETSKAIDAWGGAEMEKLRQEFEPKLAEAAAKLAEVRGRLGDILITDQIHRASKAAGGIPQLLEPHLRKRMRVDFDDAGDPQIVVTNSDGEPWLDERGEPVTVTRLVEELRLFGGPAFARAFDDPDRNGNGK